MTRLLRVSATQTVRSVCRTTSESGQLKAVELLPIEPNLPAELTFADWLAKRDPILEPHSGADQ